jgi:hypothetical protein
MSSFPFPNAKYSGVLLQLSRAFTYTFCSTSKRAMFIFPFSDATGRRTLSQWSLAFTSVSCQVVDAQSSGTHDMTPGVMESYSGCLGY